MSGPTRYTPLIFGGALTPTGNVGDFGSKAGGSPTYGGTPKTIQTAQWLQGFFGALAAGNAPYWQDENGVLYTITDFLQYMFTRGIAEWDYNLVSTGPNVSNTTYFTGDLVRRGPNSGGPHKTVWQCGGPNSEAGVTSDPLQDSNNWTPYAQTLTGPTSIGAFAVFNGTGGLGSISLLQSFNVSGVVKNSTGNYSVTFANAFTNGSPAFSGNCAGIARPITAGTGSFTFDTAALSGGAFNPSDYPYVSAVFIGL